MSVRTAEPSCRSSLRSDSMKPIAANFDAE